ncbi:hypothetical protein ABEO83_22130, partial [Bacillus glycinifermentans]
MKSLKARVFMVLSALALLTTVVLTTPASTVQAKNVTDSLMSNKKVNDVVQNIDQEDMEKA